MTDAPTTTATCAPRCSPKPSGRSREQGTDSLSLRDLARQAGVSHAAPRRHFADRQALLDALADAGLRAWARKYAPRSTAPAKTSWRGCGRR